MTRTFAIGSFVALAAAAVAASPQSEPMAVRPAAVDPAPVDQGAPQVALPPQGYTYAARGRRDPFVVLLARGSEAAATTVAARAAGLAGLNTGEVTLRGVIASEGEYVAMLLGSDLKTYIVRAGDTLADGTIRAITADSMVVLQRGTGPLSTRTEREVRKQLRKTDVDP